MAEVSSGKRSYFAMLLSIIVPGLGQIYLRKPMKGLILFFGVVSAGGIIYIHSLPVNSWRDVTRIDGLEEWWAKRRGADEIEANAEPQKPSDNASAKRDYLLYTRDDKFLFRLHPDFQADLKDGERISDALHEVFQNYKVLLYENATISTKKEGRWWLIDDSYQTYSVRKAGEGLNVYNVRKRLFRPRWEFKVSGLIQAIAFWGYAIFDGWRGRRGYRNRASRNRPKIVPKET